MTYRDVRSALPLGSRWGSVVGVCLALWAPGCWLSAPEDPPPFDCAAIDRAEERFPDECGDAGVAEDAGAQDAGDDASADDGGAPDGGDGGP